MTKRNSLLAFSFTFCSTASESHVLASQIPMFVANPSKVSAIQSSSVTTIILQILQFHHKPHTTLGMQKGLMKLIL